MVMANIEIQECENVWIVKQKNKIRTERNPYFIMDGF